MLEKKSLFFCRANLFEDPFEGSIPKGNIVHRDRIYGLIPEEQRPNAIVQISEARKNFRSCTFINCWHMNEHESAAMWRLYSKCDEAIAIYTKYNRLVNILPDNTYI